MTLYFIGLGLWDEKDISLRGLEAVKKCPTVYLESYTSKLNCSKEELEKLYGKTVIVADRGFVESGEKIIEEAKKKNVALLVVGDVFSATTHTSLFLEAKKAGVRVKVVPNASVLTAVGVVGLSLYKYGTTVSLPYSEHELKSVKENVEQNAKNGQHTLVLLDIKTEEGRFMTVNEAIDILLKEKIILPDTKLIGCARLGSPEPVIRYGEAEKLVKEGFGGPLHCLAIPGKMHFVEEEMVKIFQIKP